MRSVNMNPFRPPFLIPLSLHFTHASRHHTRQFLIWKSSSIISSAQSWVKKIILIVKNRASFIISISERDHKGGKEEFAKLFPFSPKKKTQPLWKLLIEYTFLTPPDFSPFCRHSEPHLSVRWINEDNKLVADSRDPTYQLPNRILYANGSLSVLDVKIEDTGDYICEVNIGNNRVIRQISSIEVQGERRWQLTFFSSLFMLVSNWFDTLDQTHAYWLKTARLIHSSFHLSGARGQNLPIGHHEHHTRWDFSNHMRSQRYSSTHNSVAA